MAVSKLKIDKEQQYETYVFRFSWFNLTRPLTLSGSICPVLAGTALAAKIGPIHVNLLIALLMTVLFVQAAINMLNDYFDFKKGQDRDRWIQVVKPTSGGPFHHAIPFAACTLLVLAGLLGLWIALQSSFWIMTIGAFGFILGFMYSAGPKPLCSIGLGEIVASVVFGPVPVAIALIVQGVPIDARILAVAIPFSFLIASMILTNNIRDIKKDEGFRRTLAMMLGRKNAANLLTILLIMAYLSVFALIYLTIIPLPAALVILALPIAFRLRWCFRAGAQRKNEINGMKVAAYHHWAFGSLFAIGLWLSIL